VILPRPHGASHILLAVAKEPLVYVAGSAPFWQPMLENVSSFAAAVGPIAALALAFARIWAILGTGNPETKTADRVEKGTSAAVTAATTAAKFGKWLPSVAAAIGAVALVAWLTSGSAKAMPVNPSAPSSTSARKRKTGDDDGGNDGDAEADCPPDAPAWFAKAWADKGTREFKGKRHNPKVVAYFKDAGFSAVKDDETAWCAAAVNAWIERSGHVGSKSLAAKSFMKWGMACKPRVGCVVVLHRGDPKGWQGHVGLYAGETATHVLLLGGNQGDAVSVSKFPKSRVMPDGYRWPKGAANSRTNQGAAVSAGSTTVAATAKGTADAVEALPKAPPPPAEAAPDALDVPSFLSQIRDALEPAVAVLNVLAVVCAVLGVASAIYVIWRRTKDLRERGI